MDWEKPLIAVAETDTFCEEPAARVRVVGLTESVKLGGGGGAPAAVTVSAREAEAVRVPEVPVNWTVAVEDAAEEAAESETCCGVPGVRVNVDGEAVTPEGRPVMAT